MNIKGRMAHFNIDVSDLNKSLDFYCEALGLKEQYRKEAPDGSFILVYLADGQTDFMLELTWLRDHPQPYDLGENESHLALTVDGDYEEARAFHREKGWICYENPSMGIYFISDPDGYWIEILP
jgi:lactoylglutathione lyase